MNTKVMPFDGIIIPLILISTILLKRVELLKDGLDATSNKQQQLQRQQLQRQQLPHSIEYRLVVSANGEIEAGNFSFYQITGRGNFKLVLTSQVGDADIYVSCSDPYPHYTNYDLQSATYGADTVVIPRDFARPVYISVYAHPYYPKSAYRLDQYILTYARNGHDQLMEAYDMSYDDFVQMNNPLEFSSDDQEFFDDIENENKQKPSSADKDKDEEPLAWYIFCQILRFVIEVFL